MTPRRRGTAPLEFALLLPLLFGVAVVGWWAARGGFTRAAAGTDARREAWQKRNRSDAGLPFDPRRRADAGSVETDVKMYVGMPSPIDGTIATATASNGATDDPLDARRIAFEELRGRLHPHPEPLAQASKFDPLLARLAPRMKEFAALDPAKRPALRLAPAVARALQALRPITNSAFATAGPTFVGAAGVCAALAVENYFKAPLYAEEIRVLTGGVDPSRRIPSEAVTK